MSEPPCSARVILHTSKGPLEIELWAKEVPIACRNFIGLCANGYYKDCTFHRVSKDFVLQAGDKSNTGSGCDSFYDSKPFKDEFHSRLKWNRRGLVGCASVSDEKNSNNSQFVISLTALPQLNNKSTLFGRIVGESIYNALRIADCEVDEFERPLYPTKIESCEIVLPYFEDLLSVSKPSESITSDSSTRLEIKKAKPKVRLTYDDDDEDTPSLMAVKKKRVKPVHETIYKSSQRNVETGIDNTNAAELVGAPAETTAQADIISGTSDSGSKATRQKVASKATRHKSKAEREQMTLELLEKFRSRLAQSKISNSFLAHKFVSTEQSVEETPED